MTARRSILCCAIATLVSLALTVNALAQDMLESKPDQGSPSSPNAAEDKGHQDVRNQVMKDAAKPDGAMAQSPAKIRQQVEQDGSGGGKSLAVYGEIVTKLIKQNWRWPIFDQQFECKVGLQIAPDGHIQSANLVQSSGRPDFDKSALKAVQDTENLPPPPQNGNRLELTFNSQEKR